MAMTAPRLTIYTSAEIRGTGGRTGFTAPVYARPLVRLVRQSASGGAPGYITAIGYATGTLAAGGSVEIDLMDGTLQDPTGAGVVFTAVTDALAFITSTTGLLRVGGTATANTNPLWFGAAASYSTHGPLGSPFAQGDSANPATVSGTSKRVKLANPHATDPVTYQVVFAGRV